jgi:HK97 family phage major capsid protein
MNIKELRQREADLIAEGDGLQRFDAIHKDLDEVRGDIGRHQTQLEAERDAGFRDAGQLEEPGDGQRFASLGEQLVAAVKAERNPQAVDPRLYAAPTGLGETFPSDGGYLVKPEFSGEILKRTYEVGQVLQRVRDFPMNSTSLKINAIDETSRADGSRYGGIQVFRTAEADTVTAKKVKFAQVELNLKKLMGLVYATDELLEDAPALESLINNVLPEEFAFKMEDEFFNGDGANGALGILNADCLVSVAKETGQLTKTIVYENIVKMWSRCYARSRANAVWFVNQDAEPQLFTMGITIGTGGSPVYLPPGGASASPYGSLFGRPVIPVEYAATLGTVGDIVLADFSQYLHGRKGGLKSASSIHVKFINDETTFRFTLRNDGQPWWKSALTPFKGTANTQSPFVTLAARA